MAGGVDEEGPTASGATAPRLLMPSHDLPCSLYGKPSQPLQQPEARAPKTHKPGKQLSHSQRPLHHPEPLLALMEPKGRAKRGKVMSLSDTSTAQGTGQVGSYCSQNSTPCKRVGMGERKTLRRKQQENQKAWERLP